MPGRSTRWVRPSVAIGLGLVEAAAWGGTMTVTTSQDVIDPDDGACSLREALGSVDAGSPIDASCGAVDPVGTVVVLDDTIYCLESELVIGSDVTVAGVNGGATSLDGGNGAATACSTPSGSRVLSIDDAVTVELADLALTGGLSALGGAGIAAGSLVALTLERVTITENTVSSAAGSTGGGGVHVGTGSTVDVHDSEITLNQVVCTSSTLAACARGGGIATDDSVTLSVVGTVISNNLITTVSGVAEGGGICLGSSSDAMSTLYVEASVISSNSATSGGTSGAEGGGIAAEQCDTVTLHDSLVENNTVTATGARAFGAGMAGLFCNALVIGETTFRENENHVSATDVGAYGGGLYVSTAPTTIENSTFTANRAVHDADPAQDRNAYGGGVYIGFTVADLVNVTVSGNGAYGKYNSYGGGVFVKGDATVNIAHSTIAFNEATVAENAYGGGVSHFPSDGTTEESIVLVNTILVGNTAVGTTQSKGDDCFQTTYTLGNNLISTEDECSLDESLASGVVTDYVGADPQLASLDDNGGPVPTHAIGEASEARDRGTCLDAAGTTIATDARGVIRDATCDIGAFEYVEEVLDTDDTDGPIDTTDSADSPIDSPDQPTDSPPDSAYAGDSPADDSGGGTETTDDGGCGCATPSAGLSWLGSGLIAAVLRRRRC